MTKAVMSY